MIFCETTGQGAFLHSGTLKDWMMVSAGLVTILPLLLFASAVSRVPLSTIGILQYINPTMQFLLGVFVYKEPFTRDSLIGFGIVWASLIIFWAEGLYARHNIAPEPTPEMGEG